MKLKRCKCGNKYINIAHEYYEDGHIWAIWCPQCYPKTYIKNKDKDVVIKKWNSNGEIK